MATQENYTMLHRISTTEYLNYEGGKFSKSRGTGVFGNDAQKTGMRADGCVQGPSRLCVSEEMGVFCVRG